MKEPHQELVGVLKEIAVEPEPHQDIIERAVARGIVTGEPFDKDEIADARYKVLNSEINVVVIFRRKELC